MAKSRDGLVPPVKRTCPTLTNGKEACDFYYEGVESHSTKGDWLAQFCKNCSHLVFIDKKKL